ncbi:MAG: hypothetical protein MZV63_03115 [Marinilabiliales bacterium]|nr:hypothetical protein [Marinilabiliales bacterium]
MKIGNIYVKGRAFRLQYHILKRQSNLNANYAPAYRELGQLVLSWQADLNSQNNILRNTSNLQQGNIPAKTRYVNALFYARDYDEVIKNVEEIFAVDKSRAYMNRLAGYSCYEKNNADYDKALALYGRTFQELFLLSRIIPKDYHYTGKNSCQEERQILQR